MPNIQKISIALTGEQVAALRTAVSSGEYATSSEIVREALRDWQYKRELRDEELKKLKRLWDEGKASGEASPLDLAEVRQEARRRVEKAGRRAPHAV